MLLHVYNIRLVRGPESIFAIVLSLSLSLSQASTKECYLLYFHNICWRTSSWRVWGRNKIASFLVAFACNFASIFEHELWFRNRKFSSFVFGSVFLFLLICFFIHFQLRFVRSFRWLCDKQQRKAHSKKYSIMLRCYWCYDIKKCHFSPPCQRRFEFANVAKWISYLLNWNMSNITYSIRDVCVELIGDVCRVNNRESIQMKRFRPEG